jgi:tRNA A37 N6-isopentenylltransferase MiaA
MNIEFETNRFTVLGNFGERILNLFRDKEKIRFSDMVGSIEIKKSKKGEFNKQTLFSLSKNVRDLMNKRILTNDNKNIMRMSETFNLTDKGRQLILTKQDKIKIEIEGSQRRIRWLEEDLKKEEFRLKKLKEEDTKND